MSKTFGEARNAALHKWQGKRNFSVYEQDTITYFDAGDTFECRLQNREEDDKIHINILCSMLEFSMNLHDLMTDNRWDKAPFEGEHAKDLSVAIFRFYTRVYLVASEIISDCRELYHLARGNSDPKNLDTAIPEVKQIMSLANKVFKHKSKSLHVCNNHLTIFFEDSEIPSPLQNAITILNCEDDKFVRGGVDGVVIPTLDFLLDTLIKCYDTLTGLYEDDQNYQKLKQMFGEPEKVEEG